MNATDKLVSFISVKVGGASVSESSQIEAAVRRMADQIRQEEREKLLNTPEFYDFAKAVVLEAQHQRLRWGREHDEGKTDADWFWLLGYLGGKALHNPDPGLNPLEKKLHRVITVAAAAANWHAQLLGQSDMRPGIEPPLEISKSGTQEG